MLTNTQKLQSGKNHVTFESEGDTLVGTLFIPKNYSAGTNLPVVVVSGPWTQVKEQVGYRYSEQLAARGIAAFAFDHRFYGESGGEPRQFESQKAKITDIGHAISFLASLDEFDSKKIGLLGVCAGAGNMAFVAAKDDRVGAFTTIAAWLQHPETTPQFYGGEEGVNARIQKAEQAVERYRETGEMTYVEAYNPDDPEAAMFFPLDYYGNPKRGAIEEWENRFAVSGWKEWMEFNAFDPVDNITVPTLMIHSDESALPDNVRRFHKRLAGPKELYWTDGEHTEFYDKEDQVTDATDKTAEFFKKHLTR